MGKGALVVASGALMRETSEMGMHSKENNTTSYVAGSKILL